MALLGFLCDIFSFIWKLVGKVICFFIRMCGLVLSWMMLLSIVSILVYTFAYGIKNLGYSKLYDTITKYVNVKFNVSHIEDKYDPINLNYMIEVNGKEIPVFEFSYKFKFQQERKENIYDDIENNNEEILAASEDLALPENIDSLDIVEENDKENKDDKKEKENVIEEDEYIEN